MELASKFGYQWFNAMKNILIIDDEQFIRDNLKRILEKEGYDAVVTNTGQEGIDIVTANDIDLILLDLNLPDMNGIDILKKIKQISPASLVIIITGYATVDSAVEALKLGAYDYIKKPFKADAIKLIVKLALETQLLKKEVTALKKHRRKTIDIIAESSKMKQIVNVALEVARHKNTSVLITGESGTGKEVIAHFIHEESERHLRPFLDINCASLPEQLLESELFGYEKGAFTDARTPKSGLFEEANGGTIFLDEIGEMPLALQSKLLRVIETKAFRKIGGNKNIELDVRIISATNKDLKKAVEEKKFREDLYYRLNVFPIHIPPLRERKEDIIPLTEYFLHFFAKKFGRNISLSDEAKDIFLRYPWKGNVRELKNIIERICIMFRETVLKPEHLPLEIREDVITEERFDENIANESPFLKKLEEIEKTMLLDAISKTSGNILKAARLLGIPRGTLRHKIAKHNIKLAKISQ